MNNQLTGRKAITNMMWSFAERTGAQSITFIVSIILARILTPDEFGTISLILVFISIFEVFLDGGMNAGLIQKKDADDLDYSSFFYFNVAMCIVCYILIFLIAPIVANYYSNQQLTSLLRVLGINLVFSGVKGIQAAYVTKRLIFKKFFFSTIIGTLIAAIVGIWMAYNGFGVWAIVAQHLTNNMIDTLILWLTVRWRPKLQFSLKRLKPLFNYGYKLLIANLITTIYNNLRSLVIGKMYTPSDLAYYKQGEKFPKFMVENINTPINNVLLPAMANEQDDVNRVKDMTRKSVQISTFFMAPLMIGLAAVSKPLVIVVLTEKWLICVPYLMVFCITYMFYPIQTANLNAIKALGKSDLYLKLEIYKRVMGIIVLLITMWFGPFIMALSKLFTTFVAFLINSYPNKKLLNYSYKEQLIDIAPHIMMSAIMGLFVYMICCLNVNTYLTLVLQVVVGIGLYVFQLLITKDRTFNYVLNIIRK